MTTKDIDPFIDEARALPQAAVQSDLGVPVTYRVAELHAVADFAERNWKTDAASGRPGLQSVDFRLRYSNIEEAQQLARAITAQQAMVLFGDPADQSVREAVESGWKLLEDISAALEFILDDDVNEAADEAFAKAMQRSADDRSVPALAQSLVDVETIAQTKLDELKQLDDFDPSLLSQARALADALQSRPSASGASAAVDLRNRLLTLADQRIDRVRRAARYVFRKHPEVLAELPSRYELRRRLDRRRRALKPADPAVPTPGATPAPSPASPTA